jgi:hypothetical protein
VAGVDVVLELFDSDGALVRRIDGEKEDAGEILGPLAVSSDDYFLRVRSLWTKGAESSLPEDAPYSLRVHIGAPDEAWELEPNDRPADVMPSSSPRIEGHLTSKDDIDWIAIQTDKKISISIDAPATLDIQIHAPGGKRINRSGVGHRETLTLSPRRGNDSVRFAISEHAGTAMDGPVRIDRGQSYVITWE